MEIDIIKAIAADLTFVDILRFYQRVVLFARRQYLLYSVYSKIIFFSLSEVLL